MNNDELSKLLGPEILEKLGMFETQVKAAHTGDSQIQAAISNVVTAATIIRAYHMALRIAGYTDEQAYMFSNVYASLIWRKTLGVG